jgi:hypothetical protein
MRFVFGPILLSRVLDAEEKGWTPLAQPNSVLFALAASLLSFLFLVPAFLRPQKTLILSSNHWHQRNTLRTFSASSSCLSTIFKLSKGVQSHSTACWSAVAKSSIDSGPKPVANAGSVTNLALSSRACSKALTMVCATSSTEDRMKGLSKLHARFSSPAMIRPSTYDRSRFNMPFSCTTQITLQLFVNKLTLRTHHDAQVHATRHLQPRVSR